jgi:hypothetical protein
MAVLAAEISFPAAPITSHQKRIAKGIEQLYYTKLFLTSPTYSDGDVWRRWYEMGFHVAIFSPPPGTTESDRIRVRLRAPSRTPVVSVTGANTDALKDLESLLEEVDAIRPSLAGKDDAARAAVLREGELGHLVVQPLVDVLTRLGLKESARDAFVAMLQRGFDALTSDEITAIDLSLA